MKKTYLPTIIFMLLFFPSCSGISTFLLVNNPSVSGSLDVIVDFNDGYEMTINSSWHTLNIWDISIIINWVKNNYTAGDYKRDNPLVKTLVLMTATGGRQSRVNEYVFRYDNGSLYYNFTNLEIAINWIMSGGFHLEFVIGNVPHALANDTTDYGAFDALTSAPSNYSEYRWYIGNITEFCIDHWGYENVSGWEWRLMTEPDNKDWWTCGIDEYINLYVNTFKTIKALIPDAKIVLGNLMNHHDFNMAGYILKKINEINATILPNTISFSYYTSLRNMHDLNDLEKLLSRWEIYLESLGFYNNFTLSVEEGQVLVDKNGLYLWSGLGDEMGAAWQAWMITSCVKARFKRFVQWAVQFDGFLAPKGYVQLMAEKMLNMKLVDLNFMYHPLTPVNLRYVGGFAGIGQDPANASKNNYRMLLYQFIPSHDMEIRKSLTLKLKGVENGQHELLVYRVDRNNHNFFTEFLQDSSHLVRIPSSTGIGGSIHDLNIGVTLGYPAGWEFWWQWRNNHSDSKQLQLESRLLVQVDNSGTMEFSVKMESNCVLLVEII
ncbi:MAG: GH39 family glycosyl hydrolase [Promethearchaeota archaeon]